MSQQERSGCTGVAVPVRSGQTRGVHKGRVYGVPDVEKKTPEVWRNEEPEERSDRLLGWGEPGGARVRGAGD